MFVDQIGYFWFTKEPINEKINKHLAITLGVFHHLKYVLG